MCSVPPSGTIGPSATYSFLVLYFLNQELIRRISNTILGGLPAQKKWTGYLVRKTPVADKSCREIKYMGGL